MDNRHGVYALELPVPLNKLKHMNKQTTAHVTRIPRLSKTVKRDLYVLQYDAIVISV